jgi:hypothetical protein
VVDTLVAVEGTLTRTGGAAISVLGDLGGVAEVGLTSGFTTLEGGPADLTVGGAGFR